MVRKRKAQNKYTTIMIAKDGLQKLQDFTRPGATYETAIMSLIEYYQFSQEVRRLEELKERLEAEGNV